MDGPIVEVFGPMTPAAREILTPEALGFLGHLARMFEDERQELLAKREVRYAKFAEGGMPEFLPETAHVRTSEWKVAPIPHDLQDRRVEITGPPERKMVINALNSGARCYMADFEDSSCPTWANVVEGQVNMRDAVRRTISFAHPTTGKLYALGESVATLLVRPRGWHLDEDHIFVDGRPLSGSLMDFGLFMFHNAKELVARGSGPYFYLPKLESHGEARLWNKAICEAQRLLGVPHGSVRATVLIETLPAAFEMDEILYELRDHSAGLNCGRWDYIFSFIKVFAERAEFVLPDRGQVGMAQPCMDAYVRLLIKTCHRRGAHAMGGMAAQIPIKDDPKRSEAAMAKVRADKEREARTGHDGTWVAHPALVKLALEVFDREMPRPNQIESRPRGDVQVSAADLVAVPRGTITMAGVVGNVEVALHYIEPWLRGMGCVPYNHLMEDAATAEIARSQVWHWLRHRATTHDGRVIERGLVQELIASEAERAKRRLGAKAAAFKFDLAAKLLERMLFARSLPAFLTLHAYKNVVSEPTARL